MKKLRVLLNKLLYGIPEPDIAQNPDVYRRMHRQTMTLYDKADKTKIGKYEIYR